MRGPVLLLGVAAALTVGVWFLGAIVAGGYVGAIVLTAGWFAVVGAAVTVACVRRVEGRRWLGGGFAAICAVSVFGLWFTTIRETEVDGPLELGTPISELPAPDRPDVDDLLAPQQLDRP